MVVAPRVLRRKRVAVVVAGDRPGEPLPRRRNEGSYRLPEAELRELLGLAPPRTEARAPEEALCFAPPEGSLVDRYCQLDLVVAVLGIDLQRPLVFAALEGSLDLRDVRLQLVLFQEEPLLELGELVFAALELVLA